ncbi:MAG: cytochrome c oxidase subunit 3 family protein [Phycisphaeraceae bacterium]|nr:MAG: cytochrome c oxidase subunit 3 family protein [Phycisphaeraceae bacterium]
MSSNTPQSGEGFAPAVDPSLPPWQRHKHQPHWRNNDDEYQGAKLGMWLFLTTELLLFSGMFCAYTIFRMLHSEDFERASHKYLDWEIGAINTVVLLISSFTVALAIRNAQMNQQRALKINLFITILCGLFFLFAKIFYEYIPKIQEGKVPGANFSYAGAESAYDPLFMSIYWVSTAIHGSHVVIGVGLLAWCLWVASKRRYGPTHYTSLENVGLFWHLVDLIWIFLFPLLYLVG